MKKYIFLLLSILLFNCNSSTKLEFFPLLPSKSSIDPRKRTAKNDYFLVKNLDINNQFLMAKVDSFVLDNHDFHLTKYDSYQMLFYRYSRFGMNVDYKHSEDDLIEWKGDYLLLEYTWENGKFVGVNYYLDGKNIKYYEKRNLIPENF